MTSNDHRDIAARYGVEEQNNIADAAYNHTAVDYSEQVRLGDERLVRIDRIRLLTEPGYPMFDLSYCYGTLTDGRHVRVDLGAHQFPRKGLKPALVECARKAKVHAHGLHMLDADVISILF